MSDEQPPPATRPAHFHVAKVIISPTELVTPNPEEPTCQQLVRRLRIITVNGQIWEQYVNGFGEPTEFQVVADWDRTYATDWKQVVPEPTAK
jgi:hypothetical protein